MAQVQIKLAEEDIRCAIAQYLANNFSLNINPEELHVEVKSKQNYKSEWEKADIRVDALVEART